MNIKNIGLILQKLELPCIISNILFSKEKIDNENRTNPTIRRAMGIICEIRDRLAWDFTSLSFVIKKIMIGSSNGEKRILK